MKKKNVIELEVKVIVAALTAFLTAITTTSCLGRGPFIFGEAQRRNQKKNSLLLHCFLKSFIFAKVLYKSACDFTCQGYEKNVFSFDFIRRRPLCPWADVP